MTTLVVGEAEYRFLVHQDLLCKQSPYFAAAAEEKWKEGQEHRIPLQCDNPRTIGLYVQWIYGGKIYSRLREERAEDDPTYNELSLLVEAFIFGEMVQDGRFKDVVIDSLIASINTPGKEGKRWYPSGPMVDRAYEGTPEGSPLRKLMVDIYAHHGNRHRLDGSKDIEFLKDLAGELYVDRERYLLHDPTKMDLKSCRYHHHGEGQPCYSDIP